MTNKELLQRYKMALEIVMHYDNSKGFAYNIAKTALEIQPADKKRLYDGNPQNWGDY